MPRGRRSRGQIVRRGARWGARVSIRGDKVWLGTFDTESEAEAAVERAIATESAPSQETVGEFAARWLTDYPRTGVNGGPAKSSTIANYEDRIRALRRAGPVKVGARLVTLSEMRLPAVTKKIARAFVVANPNLRATVRTLFQDAVNDDLIDANPFAGMRLPQPRGRADIVPLSEEEVCMLADSALELFASRRPELQHFAGSIRAMMLFAGYTGVRPGELFGLEWRDVDLAAGEAIIRRRVWKGTLDVPKSGRERTIVIPDAAVAALREMPRNPEGPIFRTVRGHRFSQTSFNPYWTKLRTHFEAKLPQQRREELAEARPRGGSVEFYELRHMCASWMLDQGAALEDVADQLGHADTTLVARLYGHPNKSLSRERLRRTLRADQVRKLRAIDGEADVG